MLTVNVQIKHYSITDAHKLIEARGNRVMATLLYQGHGSLRLTTDSGRVIYIDPFAGEGYDAPADLILVTHQHHDHNCTDLPAKNPS